MIPTPATHLDSTIAKSCNYVLNTWWPARSYPQATPAITWITGNASSQEYAVRGAALAALTLAVPIFCDTANLYTWKPGAGQADQRTHAARLLAAVARQHRAAPGRTGQYWGGTWQSPMWASWAGLTALIGWHDLIPFSGERDNVLAMLEYEADYVLSWPVEFWRNADGTPGTKKLDNGSTIPRNQDTAAEESGWRAQCLWAAGALWPDHPRAGDWENRAYYLSETSYAHASDEYDGYNVDNLYLAHNHGIVHPDYATSVSLNAFGWVAQGLKGARVDNSLFHNLAPVWEALQLSDLDPYGTRAYKPGSKHVQFPAGTPSDWGWRRPHAYGVFDSIVSMLRPVLPQEVNAPLSPEYWGAVRLADAADMQSRPTTATHPYGAFVDTGVNPREANYPEEEVYAAGQLAFLRLAREVFYRYGTSTVTT